MGESGGGELKGPDLGAGVPLERLEDEVPFLGHASGEQVLLVRRGGEVLAIGATCTHWGGPLAEGLVVGDTVRCPWHHACYSLRTGEALAAPALSPVARWNVEVENGIAFVRAKEESAPLAPRGRIAEGPASVVIVGGGAAGSAAAEMLRRQGYGGPVIVLDPESDAPYDRPNLSKDYLAGEAQEEWIPLRPPGFYEEHGIERLTAETGAIEPRARRVVLADGRTIEYGALLLATGASPVRLDVPGGDLPHVHTLRSFADCRRIIARAERARRVVVVGASFIGMEVAAALRTRGLDVTVVAPGSVPFERTLGAELGTMFREVHESHGVTFRLGRSVAAIEETRVRLDDGTLLDADLVVAGIGVRPNLGLAETAGLAVDRGVVVNALLETDAPGIFAAGDIARWPDPRSGRIRVEHWVVAQRLGQAAARNILGAREPFTDVPFFWTTHFGVSAKYVGHAEEWEAIEVEGSIEAQDCAVRYLRDGQSMAVVTIGRPSESLAIEAVMERAG